MVRYEIDGVEYPSVTQICEMLDKSGALLPWATKCMRIALENGAPIVVAENAWKTVSEEAKDIGSQLHDLIEQYIKTGCDKSVSVAYSEPVQNGFLAFLEWEAKAHIAWLDTEKTVYDTERCYAGTLDAIAVIDGKKYVIDFKSSRGFYDGYDLQISAYAQIVGVRNCGILRLDKETGIPEWKDYSKHIDKNIAAFNLLLEFYYMYKKRKLKNNKRVRS